MKRFLLLLMLLFSPAALAQLASGPVPEDVADEAVQTWLAREAVGFQDLVSLSTEEVCQTLPDLLVSPPARAGTEINFADRREVATEDETLKRFSYPATVSEDEAVVVEVRLERSGDTWQAVNVGYRLSTPVNNRDWLQTPFSGLLFASFSLYVLYLLIRPSFLRVWLAQSWAALKQFRGLVIGTIIAMYGLFALGVMTGTALPEACVLAINQFLEESLSQVGATEAMSSSNVARLATIIFYQNFIFGALVTTFVPASLFAFPAYLFNGSRFYILGMPFGFAASTDPLSIILILILLIIELMAYILVTAGGAMMFITIIRKGFSGFREGYQLLLSMIPVALVLLILGAWYEAAIIILPQLLAGA